MRAAAVYCHSSPSAGVAKLADARDSKSREAYVSCGFDSHLRHQQVDLLETLRATAPPNSPVREDRRGATVGQFAGNSRGWPGWADRAAAYRWCGRGDPRAWLGKPCSWRSTSASVRVLWQTHRSGDSGAPRVSRLINRSNAMSRVGSETAIRLRPALGRRTRPGS